MTEPPRPDDDTIQAYLDGRLGEPERAAFAARLLADPRLAAEVDMLQRQNEALKAVGREILSEAVPERLTAVVRQAADRGTGGRRRSIFLRLAAAIALLCVGAASGWFTHGWLRPNPSVDDLLVAAVTDAYTFYASGDYPVDFPSDRTDDFVSWIGRSFERELSPPDLGDLGYSYGGGRLLPAVGTRIGLFDFHAEERDRLAVFFWRSGERAGAVGRLRAADDVWIRVGDAGGLRFAVVTGAGHPEFERVADAVLSFFGEALDSS